MQVHCEGVNSRQSPVFGLLVEFTLSNVNVLTTIAFLHPLYMTLSFLCCQNLFLGLLSNVLWPFYS